MPGQPSGPRLLKRAPIAAAWLEDLGAQASDLAAKGAATQRLPSVGSSQPQSRSAWQMLMGELCKLQEVWA